MSTRNRLGHRRNAEVGRCAMRAPPPDPANARCVLRRPEPQNQRRHHKPTALPPSERSDRPQLARQPKRKLAISHDELKSSAQLSECQAPEAGYAWTVKLQDCPREGETAKRLIFLRTFGGSFARPSAGQCNPAFAERGSSLGRQTPPPSTWGSQTAGKESAASSPDRSAVTGPEE